MTKNLSYTRKRMYFPMLIDRDGGFKCVYCQVNLTPQSVVFDHLNNNRRDNRFENLVLACQPCNIKKSKDGDMQEVAMQYMKELEDKLYVREIDDLGFFSKTHTTEISKEIDINQTNYNIVERFILEKVELNGSIEFSEALNSGVYLCKQQTGHGSHQSCRNYIASITSTVSPYEVTKVGKKKIIAKRMEIVTVTNNDPQNRHER